MTDLEQQAPEVFALARELREKHGAVRLRNIRINVDENGDGGELIAGAWPDEPLLPGEIEVEYDMTPRNKPDDETAQPYRGRAR